MRKRELFGTDGIRGRANEHPMTVDTAMNLGRAVATYFRYKGRPGRIVVGKDTRLSGYMFEASLAAGICSMGAECWECGPLPTPGIAYLTASMRADAGLVISASHNPYWDNGIKVFAEDGFKLPDETELELEWLMQADKTSHQRAPAEKLGRTKRIDDALGRYIAFLKNTFPREQSLDGMRIVVDCANGAAYKVAPAVFDELGARVIPLAVSPNGRNINEGCGALHPGGVQQKVVEMGADLGIALDGDADRLITVDEKGNVVDGDVVMAILATRMLKQDTLAHRTLVATVMSNIGLERCIKDAGGQLVRTDVGDRHVVDRMRQDGFNLGGEQSGHMVFLDHMTTGDGVVAALQLLSAKLKDGRPLSEMAAVMTRFPQHLENVSVEHKPPLEQMPAVTALIEATEQKLGDKGRVLVRFSGTENVGRVMVEGPEEGMVKAMALEIAAQLKRSCAEAAPPPA